MCGIAGIFGYGWSAAQLAAMIAAQRHRGPDGSGVYIDPAGAAGLGHNRLSVIDLSPAGRQPMCNPDGTLWIAFNGEIYNHLELRVELSDYPYRSRTDTEVVLAAYERWGEACLDRFIGMFAFLLWDSRRRRLFAARDRFGVKPLYFVRRAGGLLAASEIKALFAAGVERSPDPASWATYLEHGLYDHGTRTFWEGVERLPPGHQMVWEPGGGPRVSCWYDLAQRLEAEPDRRAAAVVAEEYRALLLDSVRLRFRSDVPVGINLSGGLDSSALLAVVGALQGRAAACSAFTFITGAPAYDELPWVRQMLDCTRHNSVACRLSAAEAPRLAESVARSSDEPFGGIPTLAYARLFEEARHQGTVVLLDGNGMDEQWAGYDYYAQANGAARTVQGAQDPAVRPECLRPEFRRLAEPAPAPEPWPDRLRNLQYRDIRCTKLPRALRFNDCVSMRAATELREPFLDHRLVELALRQPAERKIAGGTHKRLLREIVRGMLPDGVAQAPKRPVQTPQREWLRGPLREWAQELIGEGVATHRDWLEPNAVRKEWANFSSGAGDNSFYIWQWISLGLMERCAAPQPDAVAAA